MSRGHFIHGRWTQGHGLEFVSTDPASGEVIWTGRAALPEEVDRAVTAARDALPSWAGRSVEERAQYLHRFGEEARKHASELTESISRDSGKPRWEAATEVDALINKIGATLDAHSHRREPIHKQVAGASATTHYRPHGVIAVLGPFNFPAHLPNGHIMPALLAGNTIVFKPSEHTPLVAEAMVQLWHDAGLPSGVMNLMQGARETGQALVTHAGIDGVMFTGSFETGRSINRALADQPGKIVVLEMGGNNPLVVDRVADVAAACYWTIQSAYITAGQRCSCARRLIVPDSREGMIFIEHLASRTEQIDVGPYTQNPEPFMGPVIHEAAANKLLMAQDHLRSLGGQSLVDMRRIDDHKTLLRPGMIDMTDARERADEELFGPLLQLIRVSSFEDAIAVANRTRFGLSAGLFSDDRAQWDEFYAHVRAGVVNWNRPLTGASGQLPFGGVGCSGNNRPSAYFAADYCSYPVASLESDALRLPDKLTPGIST